MKLNHKLVTLSVAALMGVAPVLSAAPTLTVQAATVYKTYGKRSTVTVTKNTYFVNKNGKKTSKKAYKNGKYIIWLVTKINGKTYYGIETDGKYWIPASDTKGSVHYSTKNVQKTSTKKTSKKTSTKKSVKSSAKKTKSTTKKTSKKSSAKTTKKVVKKTTKKTNTKKSTKKVASTKLVTIRRAQVYDKNGKKAKTYYGSKKWTIIGKNVKIVGHGTKTIKGVKYYALQPNHYYIKASDVKVRK